MEIKPQTDDREFSGEFSNTTTEELRGIVKQGINIGTETSKAAKAKRELDDRIQQEQLHSTQYVQEVARRLESSMATVTHQLEQLKHVETVTKQFEQSNKALIVIVNILTFLKNNWLPKTPLWFKIFTFIFSTVLIGIGLNLTANWLSLYIFHWR